MMKVNETCDHAVYEMKVLHHFRFAAEGLILFLLISISHILGKVCRKFSIHFFHVTNFSMCKTSLVFP